MKSQLGGLRRKFLGNHLITTEQSKSNISQEKENNEIEWITLFRRNWHIYADMVLGIKLRPFQQIIIYLMGVSDVFFAICSRGASKTFLVALGALIKMNLYPYSEVVITSSTVAQANKMVEDKVRDELIKKLSPYLLYMYEKEYLVLTKPEDGYRLENKLNGSVLRVFPCTDSARGVRATLLIYEEARLLKKTLIDGVFEKMAHPRQAKYLNNQVYSSNRRWIEECQHVYITSARYQYEWFWKEFKKTFTRIFTDAKIKCNIFASDIFIAIENGLKTWGDYRNGKNGSDADFRMEDLNEMISEGEDAFFNIKQFREAQVLTKCFRPLTDLDYMLGKQIDFPSKQTDELRFVGVDYAFANTTGSTKNDNTIIICVSAKWENNHFVRSVDYIEGWDASDSIGACDRARILWYDYNGDYFIPDSRSGGEVLFNHLTEELYVPDRGSKAVYRGLTVSDKSQYQIVPDGKIKDYISRTIDKRAIQCVIPIIAQSDFNSACWFSLRKQLDCGNIKLLCSMQDYQSLIEDNGEYYKLSADELSKELEPYGQTDMMIIEAVNLQTSIHADKIKLTEPRNGTKDRVVILSYVNYIIDLIENEWNRQQQESDYSLLDFTGVW